MLLLVVRRNKTNGKTEDTEYFHAQLYLVPCNTKLSHSIGIIDDVGGFCAFLVVAAGDSFKGGWGGGTSVEHEAERCSRRER